MSAPQIQTPGVARVVAVGGGVSGLAAAHRLRTRLGDDAAITVLESARVLGGKLAAVDLAGVRVDVGAEAFLARRSEAAERLIELGRACTPRSSMPSRSISMTRSSTSAAEPGCWWTTCSPRGTGT